MVKILLLNAGVANKGSNALVLSTIETIKRYVPHSQFVLMGTETNQNELYIKKQIALNPLKNIDPWLYLLKCICINKFRRFGGKYTISKDSRLYDYYISDLVINSGGDQLSGERFGLSSFLNISYAILLDKPVVLYGDSLGYYRNKPLNLIAKLIFNNTSLILLREDISLKYLAENNITSPKIYLTDDGAFLLNSVSKIRISEILSIENISEIRRPLIGINPSGLINTYKGDDKEKSKNEIVDIFVKVIDELILKKNASILLIPHVYSDKIDDRNIINEILSESEHGLEIKAIKNEYTAQELKSIIGLCDLFIGMRMHATIASTSMLVPTIGIAYSHKMHGVLGQKLKQEKYIIDINDLNYDKLILKIEEVFDNKIEIKSELETMIPQIQKNAMLSGYYVKELLDSINVR